MEKFAAQPPPLFPLRSMNYRLDGNRRARVRATEKKRGKKNGRKNKKKKKKTKEPRRTPTDIQLAIRFASLPTVPRVLFSTREIKLNSRAEWTQRARPTRVTSKESISLLRIEYILRECFGRSSLRNLCSFVIARLERTSKGIFLNLWKEISFEWMFPGFNERNALLDL